MATSEKLEVEIELKCNAEKFWNSIKNTPKHFLKAFPDTFESVEVFESDGFSVGSIFLVKHAGALGTPITKERLELHDKENNVNVSYNIFGGDLMNYYRSFKATIVGIPKENEAIVKWSCEFDMVNEKNPINRDVMLDLAVKTVQDLESYLLKAS